MTRKKAWTISITTSILLVVMVFAGLFAAGFRFLIIKTPSMSTAAPVGTMVVIHPESKYAIGDIVSFDRNNRSYTHRIVDACEQGWITKGDLNGSPDPLPVANSQIVGKVVFTAKYLGFLMTALPWILLGWVLVYLITLLPSVRNSWRWQIRLIGWSLVVSAVAWWLRPWVNLEMLGFVAADAGGVDIHLVNTGVFPVSVLGQVFSSGQDVVVTQTVLDARGFYTVVPQLALNLGWFLLLLAICLLPMVLSLLIQVEDVAPEDGTATSIKHKIGKVAIAVAASIVAVIIVLRLGTTSAFAATINNTTDTAGTRTWFTCEKAEVDTATARFVWSLSAPGKQEDLDTGNRDGTVYGAAQTANASSPCPRDTDHTSLNFNGGTCITQTPKVLGSSTYSLEVWFRTNTKANGKLIGFGDNLRVADTKWDRHIYIDAVGRVIFGTYPNVQVVVSSPAGRDYADNQWHHVIATSTAAGVISLYLDGNLVSSRAGAAGQVAYNGYWKVGCGELSSWQDSAGIQRFNWPDYFTGQLRFAAVYSTVLSDVQVYEHYQAGRP